MYTYIWNKEELHEQVSDLSGEIQENIFYIIIIDNDINVFLNLTAEVTYLLV